MSELEAPVRPQPPVVLTIAGSDSGGGAGIAADLLSINACGGHATLCVSAVTAQNTAAVDAVFTLTGQQIEAQISSVCNDFSIGAAKTGFLGSIDALEVAEKWSGQLGQLVVDPVLVTGRGVPMFGDDVIDAYRRLFRGAAAITPNVAEAELLSARRCDSVAKCEQAALALAASTGRPIIVTGFLDGADAIDVFAHDADVYQMRRDRVRTNNVHGTGCSFSAALATYLARGQSIEEAVENAGLYVACALASSADWQLGSGSGPIDHLAQVDLT